MTKRLGVCKELLDTERNYLNILRAIEHVFHEPLTKSDHLDATELKIIFGNVTPLLEVHTLIYRELEELIENNWKETNEIGKVFLKYVSYQVFVLLNFSNNTI